MNAKVLNGDNLEIDIATRHDSRACNAQDLLMRRLLALLDATMRETWLPCAFRVLLVREFPAMRKQLSCRSVSLEAFESAVSRLVSQTAPYSTFMGRSETMLALRRLKADVRALAAAV